MTQVTQAATAHPTPVLAFMVWGNQWMVGLVLLVQTLIPIGDMMVISRAEARQNTRWAFTALRQWSCSSSQFQC
jgi:hypothetical protein